MATAAPRPPVVVASSATTIPLVSAAADRTAPVSSGSTKATLRTRAEMPSERSDWAACSARETIVPVAMTVTSFPSVSRSARPGWKGEPGGVTSGTGNLGMRR